MDDYKNKQTQSMKNIKFTASQSLTLGSCCYIELIDGLWGMVTTNDLIDIVSNQTKDVV